MLLSGGVWREYKTTQGMGVHEEGVLYRTRLFQERVGSLKMVGVAVRSTVFLNPMPVEKLAFDLKH